MADEVDALEPPTVETTLAVVLGASEYPRKPAWTNPVLGASGRAVRDYLRSPSGLAMRPAQLLDLFDASDGPPDQLLQIAAFLNTTRGTARDLIVYYVGHGCFDHDDYCLGIRATERDKEFISTLESRKLARIIREGFTRKRVYVILDSCFAASAARDWQGDEIAAAVRKMSQRLPREGTAFLAAASKYDVAHAPRDARYTVFTGAVLDALTNGVDRAQPRLSLLDVYEEVREQLLRRESDWDAKPELHSPSQQEGDVSRLALFPNPAFVRRVEAERARTEAEAAGRAKAEAEAARERARAAEEAAARAHEAAGAARAAKTARERAAQAEREEAARRAHEAVRAHVQAEDAQEHAAQVERADHTHLPITDIESMAHDKQAPLSIAASRTVAAAPHVEPALAHGAPDSGTFAFDERGEVAISPAVAPRDDPAVIASVARRDATPVLPLAAHDDQRTTSQAPVLEFTAAQAVAPRETLHASELDAGFGIAPGPARKRSRYAVVVAIVLLGTVVLLTTFLTTSSRDRDSSGHPGRAGSMADADTRFGTQAVPPEATADAEVARGVDDAAAATRDHPVVDLDDHEGQQTAAQCHELEAQKDWQKLRDCSAELAELGAKDKSLKDQAERFGVRAVRETSNEMAAARLRAALGDGNLREAAKQLKAITPDSVYLSTATETWRAAETRAAEDAGRKAQGMASAHDCAGLRRFQAQVGATSTPSVIAGVAAVKCVERVASTSPPEPGPARTPVGAGSDTSQGSSTPSKSSICDTMNVDDVILRAQNQFTAGYPRSALSTLTKALTCRSDLRMLRMAALYACAAHDGEAARLYYGKVPAQFQPAVLQRCQAENVPLAP